MKNVLIIDFENTKRWWLNGQLHRIDGPAIEYANSSRCWFQNGKCHRLDGPAIEWANGDKEWYINGKRIKCNTQKEFKRLIKLESFW